MSIRIEAPALTSADPIPRVMDDLNRMTGVSAQLNGKPGYSVIIVSNLTTQTTAEVFALAKNHNLPAREIPDNPWGLEN